MSHVFISYSTHNRDYAQRLADGLRSEGFDVWLDNARLRASENWWEALVRALHSAGAFVILMSPAARQSKWVQREVTLADNWEIPAFPLLLEGENFEIFVLTQYTDVRDDSLPPPTFYDDLAQHAKREAKAGSDVTSREDVRATINDAIMQAILDQLEPPPDETTDAVAASEQYESNSGVEGELSGFEQASLGMALDELLWQQSGSGAIDEEQAPSETPDKMPAKKKDVIRADLNFISQHRLEDIGREIEQLEDSYVNPQVVWIDDDTVLFQLTYHRGKRRTAEVSGRLRRWAGDMTHIYCDGRVSLKPMSYVTAFAEWALIPASTLPIILCGLGVILASQALVKVAAWLLLLPFIVIVAYVVTTPHRRRSHKKPDEKDRERLLDMLTGIVRDPDVGLRLMDKIASDDTPLTDAEILALAQHTDKLAGAKTR